MRKTLALVLITISTAAYAGFFFSSDSRSVAISTYHSTVGTSSAAGIPAASIEPDIYSFKVCNDPVNTSTYLAVGIATDVATDGIRLDKGQCFTCENCTSTVLGTVRLLGQAATNGYSIVQYKR